MPCSLAEIYRCFLGTYRLTLHCRRVSQTIKETASRAYSSIPEDEGIKFLRNVSKFLENHMASYPTSISTGTSDLHCIDLQDVRKVWNQWEFYLFIIYIICSICSPQHSTHFLSRVTMFVRILLNILGSTVAQQSVILCPR
jgi:hypothetical protein